MASLFKRSSNPDQLRQHFDSHRHHHLHQFHQRHFGGGANSEMLLHQPATAPDPRLHQQQPQYHQQQEDQQRQQQHAAEQFLSSSGPAVHDAATIELTRAMATSVYHHTCGTSTGHESSPSQCTVDIALAHRQVTCPDAPLLPSHQQLQQTQTSSRNFRLSDFELLETLGTGTFGRVYLTRARGSEIFYAMKVLKKVEVYRLMQVEHINSEKQILSSINFPFIVNLQCTFQDNRNLYMLLEYVIGGELFSHLRRAGRFTNDMTRFYAAEIVLAIEYLHSMDIVYRDLKPENLLLDERGHIKITDFGFAKKVEDRTWTLCGTPEYLAPEIIQSKGHGKAVDWWALGILIFEMLAGYPPFFDDNPFGIYEKILAGRIQFPSYVDPNARDLIRRLLSADRTQRLGNLRGGSEDVRRHKWFRGVDWDALLQKRIRAPIVPPCSHPGDTGNFEKYPDPPADDDRGQTTDPFRDLFIDF